MTLCPHCGCSTILPACPGCKAEDHAQLSRARREAQTAGRVHPGDRTWEDKLKGIEEAMKR